MTAIELRVLGVPTPQGSLTRMPNGAMLDGRNSTTRRVHRSWRAAVAEAAQAAAGDVPYDGPMTLEVIFRFNMPASRSKALRLAGICEKTTSPDIDKLVRAICDGLQAGGLISDDARISDLIARKREVIGWTGADIRLRITKERAPI
jgi:Holliday junction resolvase RusA-like endonuclease